LDVKTSSIILANPRDVALLSSIKDKEAMVGVAKYLTGRIRAYRNDNPGKAITIKVASLVELFQMAMEDEVGSSAADDIIVEILETGKNPREIATAKGLLQVSDEKTIEKIVSQVIKGNPEAAKDFVAGNQNALQFLVGQVMKESKGQANPQLARDLLLKKLRQ
jgi:aspartyl-tRNA(Asn)/glutamyl-tRNA(Gln) amidotransferase subunit B